MDNGEGLNTLLRSLEGSLLNFIESKIANHHVRAAIR